MDRKTQISTTCLIGGIVLTLLGATVLAVGVQDTEFKEDLKNGSQTINREHLSAVYTNIRYSTSEGNLVKSVEEGQEQSATTSAVSDSTLLPSEIVQVTERLNIPKSEKHNRVFLTVKSTSAPEASLHPINKSSVIFPIRSLLEQEDASSNLQEETQTESVWSSSTSEPLPSTDFESTSIFPQLNRNPADDSDTENREETDRISEIETHLIANTEGRGLAASPDVEYTAKNPDDLSAQATALHSRFEPEGDSEMQQGQYRRERESQPVADTSSIAEKSELYTIPREATDIIALNAQLLGYNADAYQNVAEWYSPKHNATAVKDNEQEVTTLEDTIEITTTPIIDTTTHKRTYRRRRRRRKGQTSESSRRLQTNDSYQRGEDTNVETLPSIPSAEATEHESTTLQPLPAARNRYGMRKVKYTVRSTTEHYRRETLATTESAQEEPNRDVKVSRGRSQSQRYRKRRPRYRAKVRHRNNQTLLNDESTTWDNEQPKEVSNFSVTLNSTEITERNAFEETTESLQSLPETEHFPVTTLRTHIIQAINELQQINTLIASRKDDISNNTKNDDLPQPLILQSRPLTQNSLETNTSQYEQSFLRSLNLPEQEMAQIFYSLLNRTHVKNPLNGDLLPQQDLYRELLSGTAQNLQRFRNFTKNYEEDFAPAASTIDRNVNNIQQGSRQPNSYVRNDTQDATSSSVYLLEGIPVKELVQSDLITSEQQRHYPRRPTNSVPNICQNNTIPEIIDCIRNIEQRKSSGRKGSYNAPRKSAPTDFPKVAQAIDMNIHRSSRNSTASGNQPNKGSVRNNRHYLSAQFYSKPTEQGISVKSTTQYSTNPPSNLNRKTVSSTPKLGLTNLPGGVGGKPGKSTANSNKNVNGTPNSLSGALKVGGRMLLSQLQKLRNVILQIPGHLGRLSAETGNQKQAQKSKSSVPTSGLTPRSSSSFSFIWR